MSKELYWIDLETTGLDEGENTILEVAVAVAPFIDPYNYRHVYHRVLHWNKSWNDSMDPYVLEMHTKSGLLEECYQSDADAVDVVRELSNLFPIIEDREQRPHFAGSTVGFDVRFLADEDRSLVERFSHRLFDVSSIKLFCQSLGMPVIPKGEAHRAKLDIEESVVHLQLCNDWLTSYYQSRM